LIAEVDYSMGIADILHAGDGFDAIALVKANPQIEAVILQWKYSPARLMLATIK
jgi:hypothetical protein